MAQAQTAGFHDIIDLTGGDDDNDQLEILNAAASNAQAAANRLSSQLNSLASASNRDPFGSNSLNEGKTSAPRKDVNPAPVGPYIEANGRYDATQRDSRGRWAKVNQKPRAQSPSSAAGRQTPTTGAEPGSFGPRGPLHVGKNPKVSGDRGPTTPPLPNRSLDTKPPPTRSPRAAAQSAGQIIAKTYEFLNPIEAQREAETSTPRKPGRPKIDQWTPSSQSGNRTANVINQQSASEHHPASLKTDPSRIGTLDRYGAPASKEATAKHRPQPIPGNKRKRRSSSPDSGTVQQHAESVIDLLDSESSSDAKRRSPSRTELPFLPKRSRLATNSTAKHIAKQGQSEPVPTLCASNLGPPLAYSTDEALKVSGRSGSSQLTLTCASAGAQKATILSGTFSQGRYQARASTIALSKAFDDIVFPAIRKQKKRYRGRLSDDEILTIGKEVATATMDQKLRLYSSENLLQSTKSLRKEIKRFIRKTYRDKILSSPSVLTKDSGSLGQGLQQSYPGDNLSTTRTAAVIDKNHAAALPTHTTIAADGQEKQPTAPQGKITNLSEYLKKLENEVHSAGLDSLENPSPVRAQAPSSHRSELAEPVASVHRVGDDSLKDHESLVASPKVLETALSQSSHDPSLDASFPSGFDRGRFPAQRRRRGNKYYNPERPSKAPSSSHIQSKSPIHKPSILKPKVVNSTDPPESSSGQQESENTVSQILTGRIATNPRVKAFAKAIASGNASPTQRTAWAEFINAVCHCKNSGDISELESRIIDLEDEDESDHNRPPSFFVDMGNSHASSRPTAKVATSQGKGVRSGLWLEPKADSNRRPTTRSQIPESRELVTAFDPYLERLVAELVVSERGKSPPTSQIYRDSVDYSERQKLLEQPTLLRYIDRAPKERGQLPSKARKSRFTRIETKVNDPVWRPERRISSLLRHRELGSDSKGRNVNPHRELRLRNAERIEPWRYWKGASGDVVAVAWSSDSTTYAVGAAAHTNSEDVQYNRPCNLLLGELTSNTLTELPDHRVDRPKPETLADTYNARQAVHDACDPMVYETVSSIAFSPTADRMYTASYDCTVKIWDIKTPQTTRLGTLYHNANVTSVEASAHIPGLFATASDVIDSSIRIYYADDLENSNPVYVGFSSSRAQAKQDWRILPECIRWGSTSHTSHLLLAGFSQRWSHEGTIPQQGHLCLWDINTLEAVKVIPSSQSVLAAAWHPLLPFFATGGAPGGNLTEKNTTKSVVRTWDLRSPNHYTMEYECSALDMQDITFHPTDSNIVTAGCTDGNSFVWDYRRPDRPLHRLRHGEPLVDWDHTRGRREEVDCGVMMSLWGLGGSLFYTGSSDGMIKAWDIRRHPQDVLQRNVAQFSAGIQSGAFSPDGTNLLVGDADGGIHILSSAPCGPQPMEDGSADVSPELPITLIRAPSGSGLALKADDDNPGTEGQEEAKRLTDSMQMIYDPELGVTQGSMYQGPYATYHRKEAQTADVERLRTQRNADNKHFFLRTREENQEVEGQRREFIAARKQRLSELYPSSDAAPEEAFRNAHKTTPHLGDRLSPSSSGSDVSLRSSSSKGRKTSWSAAIPRPRPSGYLERALESTDNGSPNPEEDPIFEKKMVEENYWWPDLGKEEIERARAGRGHENFLDRS